MTVLLRGLAWDHRRCWGPLDASAAAYQAAHPDAAIHWDRRSLHDFGEGRIEDTLRSYDLVIFDHPFAGDVARSRLMAPFDPYLTAAGKLRFAKNSVGTSWRS